MKDRQTDRLLGQLPRELGLAELSQNGQVGEGEGLAIWSWLATLSVLLASPHRLGLVGQLSKFGLQLHGESKRAAIFRPTLALLPRVGRRRKSSHFQQCSVARWQNT